MSIKLYAPVGNARARIILVAGELAGVAVEQVHIEYTDLKTPEHFKRNPLGKVPVIETTDGFLFETHAILRYIARQSGKLYGSNLYQQGLVDQYLDFINCEVYPAFAAVFYPLAGFAPYDKETYHKQKNQLLHLLRIVETQVSHHKFLVGDEVSIADLALGSMLSSGFKAILDEKLRKHIPHVVSYFEKIAALPAFRKYMGRAFFVKTEWHQPVLAVQQKQVVEQQKKQQKEKESPKKKQQQSPKKPAAKKDESHEGSPLKKKEEKPAVTYKFDIYSFKTLYTNAKDKNEAVKFLVENWSEDQSLYFCHYDKYEGEGKILYQFNNQKNGFIQRCEAARKYAFGTYSIYGNEPELEIKGVWLFQGNEMHESMKENPQVEYHKWTKLDIHNANDLKIVTDYWVNVVDDESTVDGATLRSFGSFK